GRPRSMTAADRLVLHADTAWISPYVFSCFVALHEKVLPFETAGLSLEDGEHHLPGFRDRALTGRVPALQHGDFWLAESSAIVEYLDEAFPDRPKMLPEDPR